MSCERRLDILATSGVWVAEPTRAEQAALAAHGLRAAVERRGGTVVISYRKLSRAAAPPTAADPSRPGRRPDESRRPGLFEGKG